MRYEVVQFVQFMFSLSLILAAFAGGVYVGWRRWGRPPQVQRQQVSPGSDDPVDLLTGAPPRPDLFAPELPFDLDAEAVDAEVDLRPRALPAARQGRSR